jgi:hypothetical protein
MHDTVDADGTAATARRVDDRQARGTMLVESVERLLDRLVRVTAGRRGSHDLLDLDLGSAAVLSRHAAAHVALGDGPDQLEAFSIFHDGRAAAA